MKIKPPSQVILGYCNNHEKLHYQNHRNGEIQQTFAMVTDTLVEGRENKNSSSLGKKKSLSVHEKWMDEGTGTIKMLLVEAWLLDKKKTPALRYFYLRLVLHTVQGHFGCAALNKLLLDLGMTKP